MTALIPILIQVHRVKIKLKYNVFIHQLGGTLCSRISVVHSSLLLCASPLNNEVRPKSTVMGEQMNKERKLMACRDQMILVFHS